MKEQDQKGPVQILCEEVGAIFTPGMERTMVLTAFVAVLVNEIEDEMHTAKLIAHLTDKGVSEKTGLALDRVKELLLNPNRAHLIAGSAKAHITVTVHDGGPYDQYIEMLSSCVSAIRFGLETPCHSRHAASAANEIWRYKYGVKLFDKHSNRWGEMWARDKFYEALGNLAQSTS